MNNKNLSLIKKHYRACRDAILGYCKEKNGFRALIGDHKIWWKIDRETGTAGLFYPNEENYEFLTSRFRTLYWTAQLFLPHVAEITSTYDFEKKAVKEQIGGRENTIYHSFFLDLDKAKDKDIHDPKVIEWLEKAAKFFANKFLNAGIESFGLAFSGGGIYCVFHPSFGQIGIGDEENHAEKVELAQRAFDLLIGDIADEFFRENPEAIHYIKFDKLNCSAKRQVKTILSVHKTNPYAVVPLDKEKPKIDFEKARLPIKEEVLEEAKRWLVYYDDIESFGNFLKSWIERAKKLPERKKKGIEVEVAEEEIPKEEWAPCMRNLLAKKDLKAGYGATRALAILASYMRFVGVPKEKAYNIFEKKAEEWDADTSNIFERWYECSHLEKPQSFVPLCKKLSTEGSGYPHPEMGELGICTPDEICTSISHPLDYHKKATLIERKKLHELKTLGTGKEKERQATFLFDLDKLYLEVLTTDKQYKFASLGNNGIELEDKVKINDLIIVPRKMPTKEGEILKIVKMPNEKIKGAPLLDAKMLFERIKQHYKKYIDLADLDLTLATLYTLFTWFYQKTNTVGYLRFLADTGKGKTRMLDVIGDLCFYPVSVTGAGSFSGAMRTNEKWHGTMIMDESDFKGEKEHQILKYLNLGFQKGKYFPLSDKQYPKRQEWFDPFSPKIMAMREPFNDNAAEGRLLSISPRETTNPNIPILLLSEYEKEAEEIRNLICRFVLEHWREIEGEKMLDFNDLKIEPRLKQLAMPLSIIFQVWKEGIAMFREYMIKRQKEIKRIRAHSWEGSLFNFVYAVAIGEEDLVEEFSGYYDPTLRKLQAVTPSMVAKNFSTTSKNATKTLRSIAFETERRYITFYKKVGSEEDDYEERRKRVRCYVVPDEKTWKEMVQRYYYDEEELSEPVDIPDILKSSQYSRVYTTVPSVPSVPQKDASNYGTDGTDGTLPYTRSKNNFESAVSTKAKKRDVIVSKLKWEGEVKLLSHAEEGVCSMCDKDKILTHALGSNKFCYLCGIEISRKEDEIYIGTNRTKEHLRKRIFALVVEISQNDERGALDKVVARRIEEYDDNEIYEEMDKMIAKGILDVNRVNKLEYLVWTKKKSLSTIRTERCKGSK